MSQKSFEIISKKTIEGEKVGLLDKYTKDTILQPVFDKINSYSEGYFNVSKDGKWGIVDTTGSVIIKIEYDFCTNMYGGRLFVNKGEKFALADGKGKLLTDYIYDDVGNFEDGIALVNVSGLFGVINVNGGYVLPCKFSKADPIQSGMIVLYTNKWETYGEYNVVQLGKVVNQVNVGTTVNMPILFNKSGKALYRGNSSERIRILKSNKAIINKYDPSMGDVSQLIDSMGNFLISYADKMFLDPTGNFIHVVNNTNQKSGVLDLNGNVIFKCVFQHFERDNSNSLGLYKLFFSDGTFFYITKDGHCLEYDNIPCPAE